MAVKEMFLYYFLIDMRCKKKEICNNKVAYLTL